MVILGIETSCDETAAAVVKDGYKMQSSVVASSVDLHKAYGGVVPEIAARSHLEAITPVIHQALWEAKHGQHSEPDEIQGESEKQTEVYGEYSKGASQLSTQRIADNATGKAGFAGFSSSEIRELWEDIDGIAVTYGPGLGGSLLIGVLTARTLAIAFSKPLFAINHVQAHIYANFITSAGSVSLDYEPSSQPSEISLGDTALEAASLSPSSLSTTPSDSRLRLASHQSPADVKQWKLGNEAYTLPTKPPTLPLLGLIVSGGHTQLVYLRDHNDYTVLGRTQDDAVGEAFDKVAKILGLPYPGGPSISAAAKSGDPFSVKLPKSKMASKYDFSFSGLKTAVLRASQQQAGKDYTFPSQNLPTALSDAQKADIAASFQRVAVETLLDRLVMAVEEYKPKSVVIGGGVAANGELRAQIDKMLSLSTHYTDIKLCTDNAAMIASMAYYVSPTPVNPYKLDISPSLLM